MDKGKILNALNLLVLCSCGDNLDLLKPFKKYDRGNYIPNYSGIEEYLDIKDCLQEADLTLVDMSRFILGVDYEKALRYFSAVLEENATDLFWVSVSVYDVLLSKGLTEFNECITSRLESASSLDDMLGLCKLLVVSTHNPQSFSPSIVANMELSNSVLLKLVRNKAKVDNWYCNVDVKNNYSTISKLSKEEIRLREVLQ